MILAGDIGGTHARVAIFDPRTESPDACTNKSIQRTIIRTSKAWCAIFSIITSWRSTGVLRGCGTGDRQPRTHVECGMDYRWRGAGARGPRQARVRDQRSGRQRLRNRGARGSRLSDYQRRQTQSVRQRRCDLRRHRTRRGGTLLRRAHAAAICDRRRPRGLRTGRRSANRAAAVFTRRVWTRQRSSACYRAGACTISTGLRDTHRGEEPDWLAQEIKDGDAAAAITRAAMEKRSALCGAALELFVSIYGAEAGNLALRLMATGGVYLGGGIAVKIAPRLADPPSSAPSPRRAG